MTWTSGSGKVNATVELTGRHITAANRLNHTINRLQSIGVSLDQGELDAYQSMQKDQDLKYGCWLGVKHNRPQPSFKLYIEVPVARRSMALESIPTEWRPDSPEVPAVLDMIGLNVSDGQKEFYFSAGSLLPRHLSILMKPVGLADRWQSLTGAIEKLWGWPAFRKLPGARHGFSYSRRATGSVFSLFLFAEDLFADDARLGKAVVRLGKQQGWRTDLYQRLTRPLTSAAQGQMAHGICTISIMEAGDPVYSFGFPPPPTKINRKKGD